MTLIYSSWGISFECKFLSNLSPTYTTSLSDDFKCTGLPFEVKQTGKASMADEMGSRSLSLKMFEICALVLMNALSLAGNILICVSVYRNRRLRTITNLYIIALAISDLLSAVFVMPLGAGVLISSRWVFGDVLCQFHAFFSLFVIYVSPVTMGLTAVNRFVRICKSERQYKSLFSTKKSRALLAVVWTFVASYTLVPRLFGLQAYEFVPGYAQCSIAHLSEIGKIIHYGIVLTLFLITPLIATIISYFKVAEKIRQHNSSDVISTIQRVRSYTGISSQEIKLSKSLFAVVFTFMMCWIPFWVIVVLRRFHLVDTMPRSVELLCMFFLYFSNTINPFIYAGMNPLFKREFRKALCCKRRTAVGAASTGAAITNVETNSRIVSFNVLQQQIENRNSQEIANNTPGVYCLSLIPQDQKQALTAIATVVESGNQRPA